MKPASITKLVWKANGVPVKEYSLHPGLNRIGRAASNDIRIDESSISSAHCELWVLDECIRVRDLGSTNGTFVGNERVSETEIGWGQSLRLGGVELAILNPPTRVSIPEAAPVQVIPEFLGDGKTRCCRTHHEVAALFHCQQCGGYWCSDCVRQLRRIGGRAMTFCGECGAVVGVIQAEVKGRTALRTMLYWLDRLVDNFRPRPKYPSRKRRR